MTALFLQLNWSLITPEYNMKNYLAICLSLLCLSYPMMSFADPSVEVDSVKPPTVNLYRGSPGCYVACYSRTAYPASLGGDEIYALGQVRVPGKYREGICVPTDYKNKDLSKEEFFSEICGQAFPDLCLDNSCWADGNSGRWFY